MVAIITTVPGKKDKNDVILQELVASKNWKQALNHCEKRLKKGETAERLLVGSLVLPPLSGHHADLDSSTKLPSSSKQATNRKRTKA